MIFVGWVFLWESQAAHLPNLLGKDLKVILPTLLMGLLGTELTKWDSHSPLFFFFFLPTPIIQQHQPENASLPLLFICILTTKASYWLPPDPGGISLHGPKDRDHTL